MRFQRSLPETFDRENGFRGFASGGAGSLPVKDEWQGSFSLRPHAVNCMMIGRNLAHEMHAKGTDFEAQSVSVDFGGCGFDGEDALIETVESGAIGAGGVFVKCKTRWSCASPAWSVPV